MNLRKLLVVACVPCAAAGLEDVAHAQAYPWAPVRMVIPFSAGGATDTPGRIFAAQMSRILGQNVVVDNRPGAGATIGTALVAKAPADGHTLLFTATTHVLAPSLYKNLPYHVLDSFAPIGQTGSAPMALAVHPSLPVKSVKELVHLAKSRPGSLDMASSGKGSTQHLFGALFMAMSGAEMRHVPYRGSAQAMTAVLGGEVPVGISSIPRTLAMASTGRLRILGVTSAERSSQLPDVPTISEAGVKGYAATLWVGLFAPKGTPDAIVDKLSRTLGEALKLPEVRKGYLAEGTDIAYSTPAEFARYVRAELEKWSKVMERIGITAE